MVRHSAGTASGSPFDRVGGQAVVEENWRAMKIGEGTSRLSRRWKEGAPSRQVRHREVGVLSWTTEAGKRFKERLCGRVCSGEVEALSRAVEARPGSVGVGSRARWSGGVVEVPRGAPIDDV